MEDQEKGGLSQLWTLFFKNTWLIWLGGILLAFLNILLFIVKSPWGGSGSYTNWGQNLYSALHIINFPAVKGVFAHHYGLLGFVTILGAFCGALMSKEFAVRIPPVGEMGKGILGGILMGLGATLGIGCTIGGFLSGLSSLSGGSIILTIGLLLGTYLALKYLLWEMEALPNLSMGKSLTLLAAKGKKGIWQPILGVIIFITCLVIFAVYYRDNNVFTMFAIIGLLMGLILQRSRFCIVRAFREPFMTGESEAPVGVLLTVLITMIGFTVIKYMGVGTSTPGAARILAMTWVYPHFWVRALIGGFIFGLGMTIAGGCAVGAMWRTGEGQVKLWFAVLGFMLMAPISKKFIVPGFERILPEWAKQKIFLPDHFGYFGAVIIILVILLLWYLFVKWNEKTGKFSAV
ncbi:MAG: YeeE/YedE family protein [Candidatus Marinimicrobia bacterium]|nr:YeeE/YedE family protein [Candidatus Neomarinimicrobiota bacterium]